MDKHNDDGRRPILDAVSQYTDPPAPKSKALRKIANRDLPEAKSEDPIEELRRLCRQHANWTKTSVGLHHIYSDRTSRKTGDVIPCLLPSDVRADLEAAQIRLDENDDKLKREMARALKQTRIWKTWLSEVAGIGEIVGAQIVGAVEIEKATKASSLKLFMGACPDSVTGRLVRRVAGQKNRYHSGLRTALWQAWIAIVKNAAKFTACVAHEATRPPAKAKADVKLAFKHKCWKCKACQKTKEPYGRTSKYLDRWEEATFGLLHSPRYNAENNTMLVAPGGGGEKLVNGGRMQARKTGMWKSIDLFVEDLYTVWRSLEGLPVWPDWYDVRRGHLHGGKPLGWSGPRDIPIEEALEMVGDVGWRPRAEPPGVVEEDNEELHEAAE